MKARNLPAMRWCILLWAISISQGATAQEPDPRQVWSAEKGSMTLEIRGDFLPDFGIEILHQGRRITTRERLRFPVGQIEPMQVHAPWGIFRSLIQDSGRLSIQTDLLLRRESREIRIDTIELVPGEKAGHPLFIAVDENGHRLFTMTHLHIALEPQLGRMSVANAEVEASGYLADRLGMASLAGLPIAMGWLDLELAVPDDAELTGTPPGCSERPIWPQEGQFEADVWLLGMDNVVYQGTQSGTGLIKIAPSATLKNAGLADVPWIEQFESIPSYTYLPLPRDQHPYLVWNLYRMSEGRIEMLAASGAKHAFFTINVGPDCLDCGGGNTLWPGCEDVYSSGSNDTATYQGPRDEIKASVGMWENCDSFFDPKCTGSQVQYSGQWLNRLLVDPAEFEQPDAQFFVDAWYVVQYDVDIWNTMGYRPIDPTTSGSGWLMNEGPFSEGPAISEWVPANETDPMADHSVIVIPSETPTAPYPDNMPQGHLRLLVRVRETTPGRYRYSYALQNYDFDRGLEAFHIGLTPGATIHDSFFGDIDSDAANDWSFSVDGSSARFDAPADNPLTWFTLFNFEIETDALPVASTVTLNLGDGAVQPSIDVTTIGPAGAIDLIFGDRFAP